MRRSRFTEEQIIGVLKDHQAGLPVTELCRKHGISDATFDIWRSRYGGMKISDAKRLKALEEEEPQAEEAAGGIGAGCGDAEGSLGKKLLTPGVRRKAVIWAIEEKSCSERRACSLLSIAPKVFRYLLRRGGDAAVRTRLRALAAATAVRISALHILLRREG